MNQHKINANNILTLGLMKWQFTLTSTLIKLVLLNANLTHTYIYISIFVRQKQHKRTWRLLTYKY